MEGGVTDEEVQQCEGRVLEEADELRGEGGLAHRDMQVKVQDRQHEVADDGDHVRKIRAPPD